jgi:hypothetical protein
VTALVDPAIRNGLVAHLPARLVDEMLTAYVEAKQKYYEGGLRLSEVEGGRFCEAVFRLLQHASGKPVTPLGRSLDSEKLILQLASLATSFPDSIRIHIPRALRMVYDIRNKRDAAHLADGIDPNLQDATLVVGTLDWILAELIRLYHSVSADEAQAIVETLVTRKAPAIEVIGDFLKVLNPQLAASDYVLLLLYHQGRRGATLEDLTTWARPSMRRNLRRTLHRLEHDNAFVHSAGDRITITATGMRDVERKRLYVLQS